MNKMDLERRRIERITALYIGRVGDVIVATPLLRALRRRFPRAGIRLLVGWRSVGVLPLIPFVDEWAVLDKPARVHAHVKLAWQVLSEPCDLLIDMNSSFSKTSTLITRAVRAPIKLAFDKGKGPRVFTDLVDAPAQREHMSDRYGRLAAALGAAYEADPELRLLSADQEAADRLAAPLFPADERGFKVLIHPGNFDRFSFRWPEEKFIALANRLLDDRTLRIYFMGGPGEHAKVEQIVKSLKRPAPILPGARLGVSGALLKKADLFVCNITGTTHLAAALGTPTFGFYAGYTQAVWRPRGARHGGTVCAEWESCRETGVDEAHAALMEHIGRLSPWV
ncbi:MAG: glycosyltransferase family 9 protein [Elusimicrobia bacterium]|nr:glycosyltransferase family 9 protein [Elusimicrobiota bacterium]